MTPSLWSALVIFVLAPIGVAVIVTAIVLLLSSPTPRPVVRTERPAENGSAENGSAENGSDDEAEDEDQPQ